MVAAELTTEIHYEPAINALLDEFLRHRTYNRNFCRKLIDLARQRSGVAWETRCLAILMAEHQILKLDPDRVDEFDFILTELNLKAARGVAPALLKEGYSTTKLRTFVHEFRRRLARLNRVHSKIQGRRTPKAVLDEFVELSHRDCKLTLARYLFTPEEVVRRIVGQIRHTDGVKDLDLSQPKYIDAEIARTTQSLPDFEATILRCLCAGPKTYWVDNATSSRINSLVEYPLTTVVLVIKPPGSDLEFEIKRVGRRERPLSVVYRRNGNRVSGSHRLDGGSMQWLLRYEVRHASKFRAIYRLVHGKEAPMPAYIQRTTTFNVPVRGGQVAAFRYFTDPSIFGERGFREMRSAMTDTVNALTAEEGENLPAVDGDMGLTAEFLSHVAPAQAILSGTSSFRVDKVANYLSAKGAEVYFKNYLGVDYSDAQAKQFADELLDEVLGVYVPPAVRYKDFGTYVDAAIAENRASADRIFLALVRQIAEMWGTLLGIRGHSRGESFVARNVGLRTVWEHGEWKVRLIFMDHDALSLPEPEQGHFFAQNSLPCVLLDERHVWGRANPLLFPTTLMGLLISIYRINDELAREAESLAQVELKAAYDKAHRALLNEPKLRAFFSQVFISRLFDWDDFVVGYLRAADDPERAAWESHMKTMLAEKGYDPDAFDYYTQAAEKYRGFIERNAFLYRRSAPHSKTPPNAMFSVRLIIESGRR